MNNETLFYLKPAEKYLDAMPLGNGRLGAMVMGGVQAERINLNDDTLWSGFPRANAKDFGYERYTERIREKILREEDFNGAEDLAEKLQGPYNESFIPAGEFRISFENGGVAEDYIRSLDMKDGIAYTSYRVNGVTYCREAFVSFPDDVILVHLSADQTHALDFTAEFDSFIRHQNITLSDGIALKGRAPRRVAPEYLEYTDDLSAAIIYDEEWERKKGLRFECHAKARVLGGSVMYENGKMMVRNADEVYIYIWIGTNFQTKFCEEGGNAEDYCIKDLDIEAKATKVLEAAMKKGFEAVRKAHTLDMNEYFGRVSLEIEYDQALDKLPTNERMARYKKGACDAGLEKQLFDFGRYLLYSSSRPGSQAANLQGIWCWEMRPAWSSNYTININTQMNYWGVETLNMPECHMPLMDLLSGMAKRGEATAKFNYNARGFCAHHNVDLWRATCPVGNGETNSMWSLLTVGGIWLSLNVWEHYLFTRDVEFLKKHYHILKGSSLFAIDMMCEMDGGYLGLCPTTVPERRFKREDGKTFCVGAGSTFDYELITELFDGTKKAAELVGDEDKEFILEMENVEKKFPPIPVSEDGKIMFWQFDTIPTDYLWLEQLYGVYPGFCLLEATDELKKSAEKTLMEYDVLSRCFGNCWYAGAWARLENGKEAYKKLNHHISNVVFDNLFGGNMSYNGPAFQIDSNLGIIATIGEMLVRSTPESIVFAPAIPECWKNGSISGMKTRSACLVDLEWKDGGVVSSRLTSPIEQVLKVKAGSSDKELEIQFKAGETIMLSAEDLYE